MPDYHAEIINLSQRDKSIFTQFPILEVRKRFLGFVKIYKIIIPEINVMETIEKIQANMSTALKKEWYVTAHNTDKVIVVFRQRIFHLLGVGIFPIYQQILNTSKADDKNEWDEMLSYAKSLSIPNSQLDFLPPNFKQENYSSNLI